MARMSMEEYRAQFAAPARSQGGFTPNNYYPFWLMKPGQRAVIRFVPDANEENNPRGFYQERVFHNLMINGKARKVQCADPQYGKKCPICMAAREYFNSEGKESPSGKALYKKRQNISQVLVIEDPLPPDETSGETHQGKLRNIALGYQINTIIKEAVADPDGGIDSFLFDIVDGYDFIIKKTEQGEYGTYTVGTRFITKSRALNDDELAVYEEGKVDLSSLIRAALPIEQLEAMLEAHLNGTEYIDPNGDTTGEESGDESTRAATPRSTTNRPAVAAASTTRPGYESPVPRVGAQAEDSDDIDIEQMIAQVRSRDATKR